MATAQVIRAGIASYLAGKISTLRVTHDTETVVTPPSNGGWAVVLPPAGGTFAQYEQAGAANASAVNYTFRIVVLVSRGDVRAMTTIMDGFLSSEGPASIANALYADPTCGAVADWVHPIEAVWTGTGEWAGQEYLIGQVLVEAAAQ